MILQNVDVDCLPLPDLESGLRPASYSRKRHFAWFSANAAQLENKIKHHYFKGRSESRHICEAAAKKWGWIVWGFAGWSIKHKIMVWPISMGTLPSVEKSLKKWIFYEAHLSIFSPCFLSARVLLVLHLCFWSLTWGLGQQHIPVVMLPDWGRLLLRALCMRFSQYDTNAFIKKLNWPCNTHVQSPVAWQPPHSATGLLSFSDTNCSVPIITHPALAERLPAAAPRIIALAILCPFSVACVRYMQHASDEYYHWHVFAIAAKCWMECLFSAHAYVQHGGNTFVT